MRATKSERLSHTNSSFNSKKKQKLDNGYEEDLPTVISTIRLVVFTPFNLFAGLYPSDPASEMNITCLGPPRKVEL